MFHRIPRAGAGVVLLLIGALVALHGKPAVQGSPAGDEPLASWNDIGPRKALVAFAESVATPESPVFVAVADSIADFERNLPGWRRAGRAW